MMPIEPAALESLTEIFRVLGDPTRLRILAALSQGERCVGDLASQLRVTESAVSHQLRLLRAARLVRTRRDGRMIFYTLHDTHVLTLFEQALRHVQEPAHPRPGESRAVDAAGDAHAHPSSVLDAAAGPVPRSAGESGPEGSLAHVPGVTSRGGGR